MLLSAKQTSHGSSHYPSMAKEYSLSRVNTINTAMPAYKTGLHSTAWLYNHMMMVQVVLALMVQVADTVNTVGYSSLRCVEVLAAH